MANPVPPDESHDGADRTPAKQWRVPVWALVPSSLAPLLLLVAPIVAGSLQPTGFDPIRQSISSLAAIDATDRGVMTIALAVVGVAHLCTAIALIGAGLVARALLGAVGISTALVAVFPLPPAGETPWTHILFAVIGFLVLAWWPMGLVAKRWGPAPVDRPFPARKGTAVIATAVLFGLLIWFGMEMLFDGPRVGLSERVVAVAESVWPLVVVSSALVAKRVNRPKLAPARR